MAAIVVHIAYSSRPSFTSAMDVDAVLSRVKVKYIDIYFTEHQKKRLGISDGKRKGELISSIKLVNLKRLKTIGILSASKLDSIEKDLSALKICYELTPEMLKNTHFCTKCSFVMGENDILVKGKLDELEDRIDTLLSEWANMLLNTISDPLVLDQKKYLSPDQQKAIHAFLDSKVLPEVVDNFLIASINALLQGFEPVVIDSQNFIDQLDAIGPVDVATFKDKLNIIVDAYTRGKDKEKLRIVVKR